MKSKLVTRDRELTRIPLEIELAELTPDRIWTTREGKKIPVSQMSDSHLLNTIRMLRGMSPIGTVFRTTPERRRDWINCLANEAYARGLELDPLKEGELVHE